MAKPVPQRPDGWKYKGSAGVYFVWHAGKNDYRVTNGAMGDVISTRQQFGEAWSDACRRNSIDHFYKDRAESGLAALAC